MSTTPSEPATLPQSLRLPIEIEVGAASVDELRIGGAEAMPVRNVRARVHLGADGGARHRLDALAAGIEFGDARGAFAIGADAPFRVDATVDATATAKGWSATARASGPLEALDTVATVRAAATATHPAQSLDARALIRPFAAWPLGALDASVSALDLSAFTSALPTTALTGEATCDDERHRRSGARLARRWPTRARAAGTKACCRCAAFAPSCAPARTIPASSTCRSSSAELGSAASAAGSIVGRGRWARPDWNVDVELRQVQPAALDARAGSAVVSGKAAFTGTGFAAATAAAAPGASAPAPSASAAAPARVEFVADLAGQLTDRRLPRAAPRAARVRIEGRASANDIELRRGEASLGDAAAKLDGRLARRNANAPWRATGRLELARFDPA